MINLQISPPSKKKKEKEVYKDPIYGIPHFHDPALVRLQWRHDPSYHVSEAMKQIYRESTKRLKTIQANRPKYIHTRFNIETLLTSPLICFPHFLDMTNFLVRWFKTRDQRKSEAVNSSLKATYEAQRKFCDALFLLLQETSRASPVSPKALKGIYNWYLQRDSVISQNRTFEQNRSDDKFVIVELIDGKKIYIPRRSFDIDQVFDQSLFDQSKIFKKMCDIELDPLPKQQSPSEKILPHQPRIITTPQTSPKKKHSQSLFHLQNYETFDYEIFHKRMEMERQSEKETDIIAQAIRYRYHHDIISTSKKSLK